MYGPPRYTLDITSAVAGTEVAVLLSQHIVNKDRPLDDIALHVTDRQAGHQRGTNSLILDVGILILPCSPALKSPI